MGRQKIVRLLVALFTVGAASASESYRLAEIFRVGGAGTWDFVAIDSERRLLFVPRDTHTLVLNAVTGKVVADITGQKHSRGVALVPGVGRGFITDGAENVVVIFDLNTYQVLGKIKVEEEADAIVYDEASDKLLVGCEEATALSVFSPSIDPKSGRAVTLKLGGKPEHIVPDGKGRAFVALEDRHEIALVDIKAMKLLSRWPTKPGGDPVGLALDRQRRLLFVGCRNPTKLIVMGADDGKLVADLPIGPRNDGVILDAGDVFASCADGTIAVARETKPGKFEVVESVRTKPGARTMTFDAKSGTFYLPTSEFLPAAGAQERPVPKPDTFMILVVARR
jgi:hypothetical protein